MLGTFEFLNIRQLYIYWFKYIKQLFRVQYIYFEKTTKKIVIILFPYSVFFEIIFF